MENCNTINDNNLKFDHIGWRYYNNLKKKAMEQEFSWPGLILSLSIAFFIVISASLSLNFFYNSVTGRGLGINQEPYLEADVREINVIFTYRA